MNLWRIKPDATSRASRAESDRGRVVTWQKELARVLQVFDVRSIGSVLYLQLSISLSD